MKFSREMPGRCRHFLRNTGKHDDCYRKPGEAKGQKPYNMKTSNKIFANKKKTLRNQSGPPGGGKGGAKRGARKRGAKGRGLSLPPAHQPGDVESPPQDERNDKKRERSGRGRGRPSSESQLDEPFRHIEINLSAKTGTKSIVFGNKLVQIPCIGISNVFARVVPQKIKRPLKNI